MRVPAGGEVALQNQQTAVSFPRLAGADKIGKAGG